MTLTKLTPAPWEASHSLLEQDEWICKFPDGEDVSVLNEPNAKFIALARNAFDVMMRRGWHAVKSPLAGEGWRVDADLDGFFAMSADGSIAGFVDFEEFDKGVNIWEAADPFTGLVEADAWYKANVENK